MPSAKNQAVYARTDVGGAYRLDNATFTGSPMPVITHVPLNDGFNATHRNWYGTSGLAVSGSDGNTVFLAVGAYHDESYGAIFRSNNGGTTWIQITPPLWPVELYANDNKWRGNGERLAVHQGDDDILLFSSFADGMWRTDDGGSTWSQLPSSVFPRESAGFGAPSVLFLPAATSPAGTEDTVFACLFNSSVWASLDAGATWAQLPGSPAMANRMAAAPSGKFVLVSSNTGLFRVDLHASPKATGQRISAIPGPFVEVPIPGLPKGMNWGGVDINPQDESEWVVTSRSPTATFAVAHTTDAGKTWGSHDCSQVISLSMMDWDVAEGNLTGICSANSATLFLPGGHDPALVASGDMFSIWFTSDLASTALQRPTVWYNSPLGNEEVFVLSMLLPATGPAMITGTADLAGFVHYEFPLTEWPKSVFWGQYPNSGGEGCGLDATVASKSAPSLAPGTNPATWTQVPRRIVRGQIVASDPARTGNVIVSSDGGITWSYTGYNASNSTAKQPVMGVAVGEADIDVIVAVPQNRVPVMSHDAGRTWTSVTGLPVFNYTASSGNRYNQSVPVASDHTPGIDFNAFVYHDCTASSLLWVLHGPGAWQPIDAGLPVGPRCQIIVPHGTQSAPGSRNQTIFVASGQNGMFRIRLQLNHGDSEVALVESTRLPEWDDAHSIGFSIAPDGAPCPYAVLGFGRLAGHDVPGPFVSGDCGASFVSAMLAPGPALGNFPAYVSGSARDAGVFAVGSFGRGAFFANVSTLLWQ